MILSKIKEDNGDVTEAANILQELQVETFGTMERKEKIEFILEQMRLCLAKKDYIRVQIISKKISHRFFEKSDSEEVQQLKIRYYEMMIELDLSASNYLDTCKHFKALYDTPLIKEDKIKWKKALKSAVLYVLLSPHDNEQNDLLHRIKLEKDLDEIPKYKDLIECFTCQELMQLQTFTANFGNRVVEHNIRIMAKYYTRITSKRMANLLDLTVDQAEEYLAKLVVNKTIFAKIDRLAGIVNFTRQRDPNDVLDEWS